MNESNKPVDIDCMEAIESLYAWLDNELEDAEITSNLEHHLNHCKSCWSRAEMEKALTEHIKRSAGAQDKAGESRQRPKSLQTRLDGLLKKL
jgi:anti-sigma factor (TIGR02949 family)